MNASNNIAAPVSFSLDRFCAFARDAVLGDAMVKGSREGLSEQLWAGLCANPSTFPADARDSFDGYVLSLADDRKTKDLSKKLSNWKKGSPLATRLSECRKVADFAASNEAHASAVWACESLSAALKLVKSLTPAKAPKAPKGGDGDTVPAEITLEATAEGAGSAILADLRAFLAVASPEDKLAILCELDAITSGLFTELG